MQCSASMHRQEATRIWAKRDAEWEKEKQARERLMKEVLAGRQSQIDHKMYLLKTRQVCMLTHIYTYTQCVQFIH